jgi:putative flippase GtrA
MKALLAKLARYATVSAISTSVTLALLGVLVYTKALTPGWANVVATAVGTVPSFELNRRWVWAKQGRRSLGREVAPFCTLSFAGLALSTLAVSVVAHWSRDAGMTNGDTALLSQAANVATFGALWVVQFFMLDRLLFRRPQASEASRATATGPAPAVEPTAPGGPRPGLATSAAASRAA